MLEQFNGIDAGHFTVMRDRVSSAPLDILDKLLCGVRAHESRQFWKCVCRHGRIRGSHRRQRWNHRGSVARSTTRLRWRAKSTDRQAASTSSPRRTMLAADLGQVDSTGRRSPTAITGLRSRSRIWHRERRLGHGRRPRRARPKWQKFGSAKDTESCRRVIIAIK